MDDGPTHVYSATLLVLGDDLMPERVTELLGLEPDQSWRRGERRSLAREGGAVQHFGGAHEWGGWKRFLPAEWQGAELCEQLAWWCEALAGREPALGELEAEGCRLRLDCFVGAGGAAAVELGADLLRRLSGLRLNLTISFFPAGD